MIDFVENDIVNTKTDKEGNITYVTKEKNGTVKDSFFMTVEKAASIYGNNWNGFLDATDYVFSGWYGHGAWTMWNAHQSDFSGYFDGDTGFHWHFVDGSPQVRHFWVALASTADPYGSNPFGVITANAGNAWHDFMWDTRRGNDAITIMDYKLSITGIDIGKQIGTEIKVPSDLKKVLEYRLGINGPGYIGPPISPSNWLTPYN